MLWWRVEGGGGGYRDISKCNELCLLPLPKKKKERKGMDKTRSHTCVQLMCGFMLRGSFRPSTAYDCP